MITEWIHQIYIAYHKLHVTDLRSIDTAESKASSTQHHRLQFIDVFDPGISCQKVERQANSVAHVSALCGDVLSDSVSSCMMSIES